MGRRCGAAPIPDDVARLPLAPSLKQHRDSLIQRSIRNRRDDLTQPQKVCSATEPGGGESCFDSNSWM